MGVTKYKTLIYERKILHAGPSVLNPSAEVGVRGVDVRHRVERLHDGVDGLRAPREPARDHLPPQSLVAPRHEAGVVEVVGGEGIILQDILI